MPKFKVVSGKHRDGDKRYSPGDVIEMDSVPEAFKDKFERVEEPKKASETSGSPPKSPAK